MITGHLQGYLVKRINRLQYEVTLIILQPHRRQRHALHNSYMQVLLGEILSLLKRSKRDSCRVTVNETSLHSFRQK
jgi:hypothetical protein